jgi:sec-independent protein translocase protein TatC
VDWDSLQPHLLELRTRLIRAIIVYVLFSFAMWFFHEKIIHFISQPVGKLYIFNVQDAFMVRFKVSLLSALFLCFPYFVWEVWGFISPALYPKEKLAVGLILLSTLLLFYTGSFLSVFVIVPMAVEFLLSFAGNFQLVIGANQYLNFIFWSILIFGILFELPIAIGILARFGILNHKTLSRRRREFIVLIVILVAVISPTVDAISLILMSLPLIILYEIGIWVARIVGGNKN